MVLSTTIAQVQTEAAISPSITSLTTKPACMKSDQSDTSVVAAASPTCSILKSPNPNTRREQSFAHGQVAQTSLLKIDPAYALDPPLADLQALSSCLFAINLGQRMT